MGQFSHSVILFALLFSILGSATKVLPRAYHADPEPEALVEIRNVMLKSRSLTGPRNAPIARRWHGSSQPQEESNSPLAAVKRTLLGMRQLTCDPGYGLCDRESFPLQSPHLSSPSVSLNVPFPQNLGDAVLTVAIMAAAVTTVLA